MSSSLCCFQDVLVEPGVVQGIKEGQCIFIPAVVYVNVEVADQKGDIFN